MPGSHSKTEQPTTQHIEQIDLDPAHLMVAAAKIGLVSMSQAMDADLQHKLVDFALHVAAEPMRHAARDKVARIDAQRELERYMGLLANSRLDLMRELRQQRWAPEGMALVPLHMNQAMRDVTDGEGWTWEDLLAAAGSITEAQHAELSAGIPSGGAQPVGTVEVIDTGDDESGPHAWIALHHEVQLGDELFAAAPAARAREAEEIQWPKARDVGRLHDMSPRGHLRVGLDGDSDVYVEVFNDQQESSAVIEFCNPGAGGGGRSGRTRRALIALMVAMEADNAERPDLDWWALRQGASPSQQQ